MLDALGAQLVLHLADLVLHQSEQLAVARLDDFGQGLALQAASRSATDARHLNGVLFADQSPQGTTVAHLDGLCINWWCSEGVGNVTGHSIARIRDHLAVAQGPACEHGDVHGATAHIDDADPQFLLIRRQYRIAGGQSREDQLLNPQPHPLDALLDVAHHVVVAGNQVYLGPHTHTRKADRILDPFLIIDGVLLGQHVQHPMLFRQSHRLGGVNHVVDIFLADLLIGDRHHSFFIPAFDMAARDPQEYRGDMAVGHHLRLIHSALQRLDD